MDQLSNLLGGQGGGALQTIVNAFQSGQHQQASDADVSSTYDQVATQLPPDQYQQAARDAFSRLSPEQRQDFLQELQNGASSQGLDHPSVQQATADPDSLAQATTQLQQQQPGSLGQLFAPGGTFSSPVAKAALLGITAMAAQALMGRR
jgi:hypothetical protein